MFFNNLVRTTPKQFSEDLVSEPDNWKYFISAIARDYFKELKLNKPTKKKLLT